MIKEKTIAADGRVDALETRLTADQTTAATLHQIPTA
jgi:hypothetical protein